MHQHFSRFLIAFLLFATLANAQTPNFALVGFATENGGVTGGAGGTEVTVTNFDDLKKYAEEPDTKYIIYISGTIKGAGSVANKDYQGRIKPKSNKSIIGLGDNAFLDGVGFLIRDVNNVIVQNIRFSFVSIGKAIPAGSEDIPGIYSKLGDEGRPQILVNEGDLLSISASKEAITSNIWVDHCEFHQDNPEVQTNIDLYDGLLDIKNDSRNITVSWCYFHDHHKCSLVGSSDKDLFPTRKITFHHNYYEDVDSRIPLIRGGICHFFNNYLHDIHEGCTNTRMEACVRVEKNLYEKCKNTVYTLNSKIEGKAQRVDNKEVHCVNVPYPAECTADIAYSYKEVLTENMGKLKSIVVKNAGVGKIKVGKK